jgi:acyl carrier protein
VYESRTERHLVDSIAVEAVAAVPAETSLSRGAVTQSRAGLLEQVQREVREILAFDHRQPLDRNRGLFEMGMDSLSSAQLKRRLEARVGRTLPSTLIFTYPTIAELVEYLAGEVFGLAPKREEPAPKEVRRPSDLDSLTDDEIEASLLLELEKAGY